MKAGMWSVQVLLCLYCLVWCLAHCRSLIDTNWTDVSMNALDPSLLFFPSSSRNLQASSGHFPSHHLTSRPPDPQPRLVTALSLITSDPPCVHTGITLLPRVLLRHLPCLVAWPLPWPFIRLLQVLQQRSNVVDEKALTLESVGAVFQIILCYLLWVFVSSPVE